MRKLKADEIECRVAQVTQKGCSLLLYKTARVDRAILDEEFGQFGWQNDFKVIDGKMYGGIGIYSNDLGEWLWRWDAGTESNTEAIKGEASDCFKRAGFKWGIGVELYSAPFIFITATTQKNDKGKWELVNKYAKFAVANIGYSDKGEINQLKIIDDKKNVVYEMGKYSASKEDKKPNDDFIPDVIKNQDDTDIYIGLSETIDSKSALKYFNDYKDKVNDKSAFTQAWKDHVKTLGGN